jgi:hypothetical protein
MVSAKEGFETLSADAVLLIRRRRPIGESVDLQPGSTRGASVLMGSAGAGRVLHSLGELRRSFPTVIQSVHDLKTTPDDLARLDLGRLFVAVVLGSHLVNVPDPELRRAFLAAAGRHLIGDGDVLIEHHPIEWATTAAEVRATPSAALGMTDVRRDPPFVSAVSVYDVGGRVVRQPFTARVLSEAELATELDAAGLIVRQRLSPTWLVAGQGGAGLSSPGHLFSR